MRQEHLICRYCGSAFTRLRKWEGQRIAAVCSGVTCRSQLATDSGRRGGQAAPSWLKSAARKAAWDRARGVA